ncbi:MAG TPA: type I-C CRISPR-associated protein Cas5c [Flavobacteriales bacterium]|nr:type I-C CRISPR-associated protein Cas5c [Flavobacteriales bacterium]MCC6542805.1 type I-C CRISPR-associated protein Cas5 [Flavobacteriales bacterium]HNI05600.1 type I-C CRISPR-associated protein Cas5c [Flavobacteriales bacterium]
MKNIIEFKVWGRYALFTDPLTRVGGEKCSYHIPTYEALKGVVKSIYWKPTIIWVIDEVRVMKRIRTQTKGMKPVDMSGGNSLAYYTYLADVEYEVRAHFEPNKHRPELMKEDYIEGKHFNIAKRMLDRGGRQDIFLGTRECQGYVEPCTYEDIDKGHYGDAGEVGYGLTFHGFDYPDETGKNEMVARFWMPKMINGRIKFPRPEECVHRKFIRALKPKDFKAGKTLQDVSATETEWVES